MSSAKEVSNGVNQEQKLDPSLDERWKKLICRSLRLGLITEEEYTHYGQMLGEVKG